jgi:hypothetical protein
MLLACAAASGAAQLTPAERQGIVDTLYIGNMTLQDLQYARRPHQDAFRLDVVNLGIDRPLEALERLMDIHRQGGEAAPSGVIRLARVDLLGDATGVRASRSVQTEAVPAAVPEALRDIVSALAEEIAAANATIRDAVQGLTAEERRQLIEGLPQWATGTEEIAFEFVKMPRPPQDTLLRLLAKVDHAAIRLAAEELAGAVESRIPRLRELARTTRWEGYERFRLHGYNIVVAGVGDNLHRDRDVHLTIDLGGNDSYLGRAGSGIGYASVLIDLGGDDNHKAPDLGAGSGLLGVGLAYHYGGHDNYRGQSLAFGAGLAGVGMFFRDGGNDSYQSVALSQGFGQFGIGVLIDTRGNDLYEANLFAQGAARTQGVGWLIDRIGNDTYRAGGLVLHQPLFDDVHFSFSQGFASGYAGIDGGLSGGVGLVTDLSGDDAFLGETYCQAAADWYALGSLYNGEGRDTYRGHHFAQAAGTRSGAGYLIELGGDDSYIVSSGASHALGQDYGVGVLFDRAGNDVYAGGESRPGIGNANGLGLFIDVDGADRYFGPPGVGNLARGTGSLGLFLDLNGPDRYAEGLADAQAAYRPRWGLAYDVETTVDPEPDVATGPAPTPGSLPDPGSSETLRLFRTATYGARSQAVEALSRLIGIGMPAVQARLAAGIGGATEAELATLGAVVSAVGTPAREAIAGHARGTNEREVRAALQVAIDSNTEQIAPLVPGLLEREGLEPWAAQAAGAFRVREAVPQLLRLAGSRDGSTALAATVALLQLEDAAAISTAQALLLSEELPVRQAAIDIISRFLDGVTIARGLLGDSTERNVRTGIQILSRVGTDEALALIGPKVVDDRPGVRIEALLALDGRAPQAYRQAILERRRDPVALVRAVAQRIDPGR